MAWEKNGTVTAVVQTLTNLTPLSFNQILNYVVDNGSAIDVDLRIDNLSTNTYAYAESDNGSADVDHLSQTEYTLDETSFASPRFSIVYALNRAGTASDEKLFIGHVTDANTAGSGNAPNRVESAAKESGTTVQWTRLDILETQVGSFTSASNLTLLSTD